MSKVTTYYPTMSQFCDFTSFVRSIEDAHEEVALAKVYCFYLSLLQLK